MIDELAFREHHLFRHLFLLNEINRFLKHTKPQQQFMANNSIIAHGKQHYNDV